jgi:fermentation-respiration switch protein FrsA (DUF1100 family)
MLARRALRLAIAACAIAGAFFITRPYVQGLLLVVRVADLQGFARRAADSTASPVTERDLEMPLPGGVLRARVYEPSRDAARTVLLVAGLHPAGSDEARFAGLARDYAASGIRVVTPDIAELREFVISPAITDQIEASAVWLAAQPAGAPDGKIGLVGISFSGGLAVVAAGRPALRDRAAYVFSYGGHADLPRVLKYVCTGVEEPPPDSESPLRGIQLQPPPDRNARDAARGPGSTPLAPPLPHDYGVALLLFNLADRVVPRAQVHPLRAAVKRFLLASALDRVDKPKAAEEFAALRTVAKGLPQPSATLLGYVNDRDVVHLGARLAPHVESYGKEPGLSPVRAPQKPSAPVFLLHGLDDNVIPAAESVHLTAALRGIAPVRLLLTRLVTHGDIKRPVRIREALALASFAGDLLNR